MIATTATDIPVAMGPALEDSLAITTLTSFVTLGVTEVISTVVIMLLEVMVTTAVEVKVTFSC